MNSNKNLSWLIYGYKGWLGSKLIKLLKKYDQKIIFPSKRLNNEDLITEIKFINPDRIICIVGRTRGPNIPNIDYLEQEGKLYENIRDNLFSQLNLSFITQKLKIHTTIVSTGCIYSYSNKKKKFLENDLPNFFGSSYSVVKGFNDRLLKNFSHILSLRVRMPITENIDPRNFITKLTKFEYIYSVPNSMTVIPEMLPILLDMSSKKITGTFNFTNPGTISHNEILQLYKEIVDPSFKWKNCDEKQLKKIIKAERSNNELDASKLKNLYPNLSPIKESVKTVLKIMKNNIR